MTSTPQDSPSDDTASFTPEDPEAFTVIIRNVQLFASTDLTRPLLAAVNIEPHGDGARIVATNSYELAWADIPGTFEGGSFLIPLDLLKEPKARTSFGRVAVTGGMVELDAGRNTFRHDCQHGDYPKWQLLVPSDSVGVESGALSPDRLNTLSRLKPTHKTDHRPVMLWTRPLKPVVWSAVSWAGVQGLAMPFKPSGDGTQVEAYPQP